MSRKTTNVFVSYSHKDEKFVRPIVQLLRASKALVFQDVDSIQAGKKWRNEIAKGLADSHQVVVFWCDHAQNSDEVEREWKAAIKLRKDLLPLLLDATPLPRALSEYQWIDLQGMVGASHNLQRRPSASQSSRRLHRRRSSFKSNMLAASALFLFFSISAGVLGLSGVAGTATSISYVLFVIFMILGFLSWLVDLFDKSTPEVHSNKDEAIGKFPSTHAMARVLADRIEAEIIRRSGIEQHAEVPPPQTTQG